MRNGAVQAAIYCRISKDRDGEALGVERQEQDCRALAERLGWDVVAVFVDNDISASTRSSKPRPQYVEMLRLARAGGVGAILAYSNSRLTRRPAEWLSLIELANSGRIRIKTVASGEHDLSTADGRATAITVAAWDAAEAERTAERVSRAKTQAAEQGKYRGGPRPYGFESDGVTVREDEARVIRDASQAILAGRSLTAVAHELNEQGCKTSMGREWTYMRLRDVLVRPRNAGKMNLGRPDRPDYRPGRAKFQILDDVKTAWPAIVDEDTWHAVHALLLDPSRRVHTSTEPRWLGSNTYICGRDGCGAPMRATSKRVHESSCDRRPKCGCPGLFHYRCSEQNHLSIAAVKTDNHVREVVAEIVRDPRVVEAMSSHADDALRVDRERRTVLMASLAQTETDYDNDVIDGRRYKAKSERVKAELAEIEERLAEGVQQTTVSPIFNHVDPGAAFLSAPVDVQRAVLRTVLRVEVQPVAKRGDKWTSDRLQLAPIGSDR
jgi:site-specific DNA recombinase